MKYIAAYLLLTKAGNESPSKADLTKVLEAAGSEIDDEKLDKFVAEIDGKTSTELLEQGQEKLASVPAGAAAPAAGEAAAESGAAAEEEAEEEEEEESDDDMGMGLFD